MNSLSTIFHVIATSLSVFALLFAVGAYRYAKECLQWIETNNKKSLGLKQLTQLHAELTDQADSIKHLNTMLTKLRSRIAMRDKRARDTVPDENGDDTPDPVKDPEAWKRHMRLQLHMKGKN